jgi:FkbM family methyltransferase
MTIKHQIRLLAQKAGLEISRYNATESQSARMMHQMAIHNIESIIDVGANDGGYGKLVRQLGYRGKILSFEPLIEAHKKVMETSKNDALWEVHERCAIGKSNGIFLIHVAGNSTSSSLLSMNENHKKAAPQSATIAVQECSVKRLDDLQHPNLDGKVPTLMKVDTQGFELEVLEGAKHRLKNFKGLQVELSTVALYQNQPLFIEVIGWIEKQGFQLWNIVPGFTSPLEGRMLQMDGIFYRDK